MNSNWSGRTPRSLAEAFGPHTNSYIHVPDERISLFACVWQWLRRLLQESRKP